MDKNFNFNTPTADPKRSVGRPYSVRCHIVGVKKACIFRCNVVIFVFAVVTPKLAKWRSVGVQRS